MKHFRKPYLAIFLATLLLFVSCSEDSMLNDTEFQTQTLEEYFTKHIDLASKMVELKNYADYDVIDKLVKTQNKSIEISDLKLTLKNESIEISDEIFELLQELIENTRILYNNPKYNSLNQEEFLTLVTDEIKSKIDNESIFSRISKDCEAIFDAANEECLKDFAAAVATLGVVGLFTSFGVGSLIGGGIALIRFGECNKSAQADFEDCEAND